MGRAAAERARPRGRAADAGSTRSAITTSRRSCDKLAAGHRPRARHAGWLRGDADGAGLPERARRRRRPRDAAERAAAGDAGRGRSTAITGRCRARRRRSRRIVDLLENGETKRLNPLPPCRGGGIARRRRARRRSAHVRSRPARATVPTRPVQDEQRAVLRRPPGVLARGAGVARHGGADHGRQRRLDLHPAAAAARALPLVAPDRHRMGDEQAIVGEMDRSLAAGLYPDAPGTHADLRQHDGRSEDAAAAAASSGGHRRRPGPRGQPAGHRSRSTPSARA